MSYRIQKVLALIMVSILLTACNGANKDNGNNTATIYTPAAGSTVPASATPSIKTQQIEIENYAFKPAQLTTLVGTKVTWVNKDKIAHTATSNDKRFDSGLIGANSDFAYTFTAPGTYAYHCTPHPRMTGQIIVK